IGTGPLRKEYEGLASRLGIASAVHFLGARPDVPDCLGAMDVFVLPSRNEGMGRALVEAMAAGRPVVATRVGGVPAVVEDRRSGLLVPPANPDALAAALDELLRRPAWAKELGAAAREAIGARFGHEAMVRAVEAVYDQVAGQVERHDDSVA
ncbi:MAG: glycosyltransferase, partial [Nitrospirales bacterium]